ncbi:hypothetical protein NDAWWUGD_CDS0004 [Salmonella phage SeKF_80]
MMLYRNNIFTGYNYTGHIYSMDTHTTCTFIQ